MEFNTDSNELEKDEVSSMHNINIERVLNKRALFSDGTKGYRIPAEPMLHDVVRLRFRTAKDNVDSVFLFLQAEKIKMERASSDELFDYYEASIQLNSERFVYCFEIAVGESVCYYNKLGVSDQVQEYYNFVIMPGYKTPDWAKGAVFYQIFVDRFSNGDTNNDVQSNEYRYIGENTTEVNEWNKYPNSMGIREFYGGDLKGVMNKLDYLMDLGVEVIYLNPIFVSPSNHKYDIQDYDYIDPHFGVILEDKGKTLEDWEDTNINATKYISRVTSKANLEASNELFIELVEEIHKRGMKIILDGVFNHCGSFNKWLDRERIYENEQDYAKGAYVDSDSPYRTFFRFRGENWPYNGQYDGWWGHDTLPKLNYEDSELLYEYIMEIAKKWVSPPFNVDGWRLDVAADLGHSNEYNHKFWKDFRKNVKEANPNALILAEHYGDPESWLRGDEWDTVMNYDAFMEPLTWFLTGMEKHSDDFRPDLLGQYENFFASMKHHMSRFNTQSLEVAMNELSNHDHSRFLTRTNRKTGRTNYAGAEAANQNINKGIFREAIVVQMTWPGAPTLYYGDEAGLCGWTDPDNRRTYPWGNEDKELIKLHKELISIHKDYEAFKTGSIIFLSGRSKFICYGRFDDQDKMVVAVNNNDEEITVEISVWELGIVHNDRLVRLIQTNQGGFTLEAVIYNVVNGVVNLTMPPISAVILKDIDLY